MSVWRLSLGIIWLGFGLLCILGRHRINARHVRLRGPAAQPPMLWVVLGSLYALVGVMWLIAAFV